MNRPNPHSPEHAPAHPTERSTMLQGIARIAWRALIAVAALLPAQNAQSQDVQPSAESAEVNNEYYLYILLQLRQQVIDEQARIRGALRQMRDKMKEAEQERQKELGPIEKKIDALLDCLTDEAQKKILSIESRLNRSMTIRMMRGKSGANAMELLIRERNEEPLKEKIHAVESTMPPEKFRKLQTLRQERLRAMHNWSLYFQDAKEEYDRLYKLLMEQFRCIQKIDKEIYERENTVTV